MSEIAEILRQFYAWVSMRFKIRRITEKKTAYAEADEIETRDRVAIGYELRNMGEVLVIIDSVLTLPPNTTYSNSNPEGYEYSAPVSFPFDTANAFGKNTGALQRLEVVIKQVQDIHK